MAKIKKTLLSIVFSIVILFGWSVFNSNNVNADEKVYEIGTDVTFAPFEFQNTDNGVMLSKGIKQDIISGFHIYKLPASVYIVGKGEESYENEPEFLFI